MEINSILYILSYFTFNTINYFVFEKIGSNNKNIHTFIKSKNMDIYKYSAILFSLENKFPITEATFIIMVMMVMMMMVVVMMFLEAFAIFIVIVRTY